MRPFCKQAGSSNRQFVAECKYPSKTQTRNHTICMSVFFRHGANNCRTSTQIVCDACTYYVVFISKQALFSSLLCIVALCNGHKGIRIYAIYATIGRYSCSSCECHYIVVNLKSPSHVAGEAASGPCVVGERSHQSSHGQNRRRSNYSLITHECNV